MRPVRFISDAAFVVFVAIVVVVLDSGGASLANLLLGPLWILRGFHPVAAVRSRRADGICSQRKHRVTAIR